MLALGVALLACLASAEKKQKVIDGKLTLPDGVILMDGVELPSDFTLPKNVNIPKGLVITQEMVDLYIAWQSQADSADGEAAKQAWFKQITE